MAFRPFARRHGRGCPVLETAPVGTRGFLFCRRKPLCLSCAPPSGPSLCGRHRTGRRANAAR